MKEIRPYRTKQQGNDTAFLPHIQAMFLCKRFNRAEKHFGRGRNIISNPYTAEPGRKVKKVYGIRREQRFLPI